MLLGGRAYWAKPRASHRPTPAGCCASAPPARVRALATSAKFRAVVHPRLPRYGNKPIIMDVVKRCPKTNAAAAAAAAAAAPAAAAGLSIWVQWLLGIGVFVFSITASTFLVLSLPTLLAVRRAARQMEVVMLIMEQEMPDTMKAMRLSSLEITDCIEEFTDLGSDVVSGIRASASAVVAADKGMKTAVRAVSEEVIPAIQARAPAAKESLEESLRNRAKLEYTRPIVRSLGFSTANSVKTMTSILKSVNLGGKALSLWRVYTGFQREVQRARASRGSKRSRASGRTQSARKHGDVEVGERENSP